MKKIFKSLLDRINKEKIYGGEGYFISKDSIPIHFLEAIRSFDKEYEMSLKNRTVSREFILELYRYNKEKEKYEYEKKMYMEIIQGFVSIDIEDETDIMYYSYVELNGRDEMKSFPDVSIIWSFSIKGMPLKDFAKSKEEVYKVIEAFYADDLSEIRNNFIIETKKDLRKSKSIPDYIISYLEKMKKNEEINKEDFRNKLKKLDIMLDEEIIRDILYEKIENYIKENSIKEVTFDTGEVYGYNRIMEFIKENLVQPY